MLVRTSLLALSLALAACSTDEQPASPCYAPAMHEYKHTIRTLAELSEAAIGGVALPGGKAFVFTTDADVTGLTGWRIDPSGSVVELGSWDKLWGPLTVLASGNVLLLGTSGCESIEFDPDTPGTTKLHDCTVENFDPDVLWQAPGGRILMFGMYFPENDGEGGVFELDLLGDTARKLDTRAELGFGAPPERPLQLCDGRLVFSTQLYGGDVIETAPAIHQFDPATDQVTTIDLPYQVRDAVQLDTTTALAIGYDESSKQVLFELDLETGATVAIDAPIGDVLLQFGRRALVGLADGGALVLAEDGAVHRYLPDEQRIEPLGVAFSALPHALVRLSTGPVLALQNDGRVEIFE